MSIKLRKVTICWAMALVILAGSFATFNTTAYAAEVNTVEVEQVNEADANAAVMPASTYASPYWGSKYFSAGASSITFPVQVDSIVTAFTVKAWNFSSDFWILVDIYNPYGVCVSSQTTHVISNGEIKNQPLAAGGGLYTGEYTVKCTLIQGTAGGWMGVWLF